MLLLAVLFRYNNYLLYYTCCEWSFWAIFSILTQDYTKIWRFNFLQFSWPRGYTKLHKNLTLQFSPIFMTPVHEFSQKSETSIFSNFHDMLYFSSIFMTPGKQNYTKIWHFNFLKFSWPQNYTKIWCFIFLQFSWLHKNQALQFPSIFITLGTQKLHKHQMLQFSPIFMTFHKNQKLQFHDPG